MALSNAAAQAAHAAGLLIDGVRIDRAGTARRIIEVLVQQAESVGGATSPNNALTLDQICMAVFGCIEPELYQTVSQLCTTAANGMVQQRLNGAGVMLCGARVTKAFTIDNSTVSLNGMSIQAHRTFTVRFLSDDPNTVVATLIEPKTRAFGRAAERFQALLGLTEHRMPQLGEYLRNQRLLSSQNAAHTLGSGTPPVARNSEPASVVDEAGAAGDLPEGAVEYSPERFIADLHAEQERQRQAREQSDQSDTER
jgi:hypothetical protein